MSSLRNSWEKRFLINEGLLALGLVILFVVWCEAGDGLDHVDRWMHGNRSVIYATVASVSGVLLGFSITAVSILIGFVDSDRFQIVRDAGRVEDIWDVFFQAIWAFGASTASALAGLVFDRDSEPNRVLLYVNVLALTFATFRSVREVWVLDYAVSILTPRSKTKS